MSTELEGILKAGRDAEFQKIKNGLINQINDELSRSEYLVSELKRKCESSAANTQACTEANKLLLNISTFAPPPEE